MAVGKEEAQEIVKARTDKREYRRIVLSNSLEVLLVSDTETDKVSPAEQTLVLISLSFSIPNFLLFIRHFFPSWFAFSGFF